jgi:hypothetical protein
VSQARIIELALMGAYAHISAAIAPEIAEENALITDGVVLASPWISFAAMPDTSHPSTLVMYQTGFQFEGNNPGSPIIAIDFTLDIFQQGRQTSALIDTCPLQLLRMTDVINCLFNDDVTLGGAFGTSGISHAEHYFDTTNHAGYARLECRGIIQQ